MSVSTETRSVTYTGNGTTKSFSVPFQWFDDADILLTKYDVGGAPTVLVQNTDYTLTGEDQSSGGTAVLTVALPQDYTLTAQRLQTMLQPASLASQTRFDPRTVEQGLDRMMMAAQDIDAQRLTTADIDARIAAAITSGSASVPQEWHITGSNYQSAIGTDSGTYAIAGATSASPYLYLVAVDGALQRAGTDYSVDGTNQTITLLPLPSGSAKILVRNLGYAVTYNLASNSSVLATGSTTSRTLADRFAVIKYVDDFGAVGDGTTDDFVAIMAARTAAGAGGVVLFGPSKTYLVGTRLEAGGTGSAWEGCGWSSIVKAKSTIASTGPSGYGLFNLGVSGGEGTSFTNVSIRNLCIDGNNKLSPIFAANGAGLTIDNVLAKNGKDHACVEVWYSTDVRITGSRTDHSTGEKGDGINLTACTRGLVASNHIYDYTRIGIDIEGDQGSQNGSGVTVIGNEIHGSKSPVAGQPSAAIWVENNAGASVIGNFGYDLQPVTPDSVERANGIVIGPVDSAPAGSQFLIVGNRMHDCEQGYSLNGGPRTDTTTHDCIFASNTWDRGTATALRGLIILGGRNVKVQDFSAADAAYASGTYGTVVIDPLYTDIQNLTITGCQIGSMTHTSNDAADIQHYNQTNTAVKVVNMNIYNNVGVNPWKLAMRRPVTSLRLAHTDFKWDMTSTNHYGLMATSALRAIGCSFTQVNASTNCMGLQDVASIYNFESCTFDGVATTINKSANTNSSTYNFTNCTYRNGCSFIYSGKMKLSFRGGDAINFNTTNGLVKGNQSAQTSSLYVGGGIKFESSTNSTALVLGSNAPNMFQLGDYITDSGYVGQFCTMVPTTGGFNGSFLSYTGTWNPANLPLITNIDTTTVTITGAAVGDLVVVAHDQIGTAKVALTGQVSSADNVTVMIQSADSGGAVNINSGTLRVRVIKQ